MSPADGLSSTSQKASKSSRRSAFFYQRKISMTSRFAFNGFSGLMAMGRFSRAVKKPSRGTSWLAFARFPEGMPDRMGNRRLLVKSNQSSAAFPSTWHQKGGSACSSARIYSGKCTSRPLMMPAGRSCKPQRCKGRSPPKGSESVAALRMASTKGSFDSVNLWCSMIMSSICFLKPTTVQKPSVSRLRVA